MKLPVVEDCTQVVETEQKDEAAVVEASVGSMLLDPEPWPEPVDGSALMEEVMSVLKRHTVLSPKEYSTIAAWCIYTYCPQIAVHSPYLGLQSPTFRCGKTSALTTLGALVFRPLCATHMTGPALFRMVNEHKPTLLVDEIDQIIHRNKDLHAILNAGHNRRTAQIPRVNKEGGVTLYDTFGPKALAGIGRLPATLQDRSIVINLRRKMPSDEVVPLPQDAELAYCDIRRRIARWVEDHRDALTAFTPVITGGINDRATDNWRPLLAIAHAVGPQCHENMIANAIEISRLADEESVDSTERLIRDVRSIFMSCSSARIPVKTLLAGLHEMGDQFWTEYQAGQPLTAAALGRMISPFGVHSRCWRIGKKAVRVYLRDDLKDAFERYGEMPAA